MKRKWKRLRGFDADLEIMRLERGFKLRDYRSTKYKPLKRIYNREEKSDQ